MLIASRLEASFKSPASMLVFPDVARPMLVMPFVNISHHNNKCWKIYGLALTFHYMLHSTISLKGTCRVESTNIKTESNFIPSYPTKSASPGRRDVSSGRGRPYGGRDYDGKSPPPCLELSAALRPRLLLASNSWRARSLHFGKTIFAKGETQWKFAKRLRQCAISASR